VTGVVRRTPYHFVLCANGRYDHTMYHQLEAGAFPVPHHFWTTSADGDGYEKCQEEHGVVVHCGLGFKASDHDRRPWYALSSVVQRHLRPCLGL
jgi:hypothetical protein